ncbi:transposase, partial [Burkholderia multivorans]|uniref:transposase n=1 Tax=Burkholderia multivorans TaxID=87883 RepID=UPI0020B23E14
GPVLESPMIAPGSTSWRPKAAIIAQGVSFTSAPGVSITSALTDISCASELVEHLRTGAVIADKGYDSNAFVESIRATRAKAVIPPRSNRKTKRRYSRVLYRTRNIVERFFSRIKHFRRVATRYDKLAGNYLAFASLACAFGPLVRM